MMVVDWRHRAAVRTWAQRRPAAPPAPAAAIPVVAATVTSHDVPIYLQGVGQVNRVQKQRGGAEDSSPDNSPVSIFTQGQAVHAGDLAQDRDEAGSGAARTKATADRDRTRPKWQMAEEYRTLDAAGGEGH